MTNVHYGSFGKFLQFSEHPFSRKSNGPSKSPIPPSLHPSIQQQKFIESYSSYLLFHNELPQSLVTESTILLYLMILCVENLGRAQLSDYSALCGVSWVLRDRQMVADLTWIVQNGSMYLSDVLAGAAERLGSVGLIPLPCDPPWTLYQGSWILYVKVHGLKIPSSL